MQPPKLDEEGTADDAHALRHRHLYRQVALQAAATFAVLSLAWPYFGIRSIPLPWPWVALAIGAIALSLSVFVRSPWWWQLIQAAFAPMAWLVSTQGIAPGWFLGAFAMLLLVYRGAVSGQIPLYFSNRATIRTLIELIPTAANTRFIDLGAGIGSALLPLATARTNAHFTGLENAPATWLIGWVRSLRKPNCKVRLADFWQENLSNYDVVYAFLSPSPMAELWKKVLHEMRPGSLFISNTFAIPEVSASRVIQIDDARQTLLYCYQR